MDLLVMCVSSTTCFMEAKYEDILSFLCLYFEINFQEGVIKFIPKYVSDVARTRIHLHCYSTSGSRKFQINGQMCRVRCHQTQPFFTGIESIYQWINNRTVRDAEFILKFQVLVTGEHSIQNHLILRSWKLMVCRDIGYQDQSSIWSARIQMIWPVIPRSRDSMIL